MCDTTPSETLEQSLLGDKVSEAFGPGEETLASTEAVKQAQQVFDAELNRRINELSLTSQEEQLAPLQSKLDEINASLVKQMENEPQPGLFKTKDFTARVANWEHRKAVMEAERGNVSRQIDRIRLGSVAEHEQERIAREARTRTTQALPKESELIANHRAANALVKLTGELSTINKQLTQARERGDSQVMPELLKKQSKLLGLLQHRKSINSRLTDKQKAAVIGAKKITDKVLSLVRGLDRGLGR